MFYTCTILITLLYMEACGRLITQQDCKQAGALPCVRRERKTEHQRYVKLIRMNTKAR